MPSEWAAGLTALTELRAENSGLRGELRAAALTGFPALRRLSLRNNALTGNATALFRALELPALEELDLRHNWLEGALPTAFPVRLPALVELDLGSNNLSGLLPRPLATRQWRQLILAVSSLLLLEHRIWQTLPTVCSTNRRLVQKSVVYSSETTGQFFFWSSATIVCFRCLQSCWVPVARRSVTRLELFQVRCVEIDKLFGSKNSTCSACDLAPKCCSSTARRCIDPPSGIVKCTACELAFFDDLECRACEELNCSEFVAGWSGAACLRYRDGFNQGTCSASGSCSIYCEHLRNNTDRETTPDIEIARCGDERCRRDASCQSNTRVAFHSTIADICFVNGEQANCDFVSVYFYILPRYIYK